MKSIIYSDHLREEGKTYQRQINVGGFIGHLTIKFIVRDKSFASEKMTAIYQPESKKCIGKSEFN